MQLEKFHKLHGKLMFAHFGTLSPIVDRVADVADAVIRQCEAGVTY
jgi:hypothetical protein